jgi:hypothetical protein
MNEPQDPAVVAGRPEPVTERAGVVVCAAWTVHLVDSRSARALLLERCGTFGKSFGRPPARLEMLATNELLSGDCRPLRVKKIVQKSKLNNSTGLHCPAEVRVEACEALQMHGDRI